ncbi:MAG TPA: HAMP domain-containing sensor histidine kinase [Chryseolinea sp.]|nr:HAMP domain-containing sensor histidine kinase [Chryseolinea sp.]
MKVLLIGSALFFGVLLSTPCFAVEQDSAALRLRAVHAYKLFLAKPDSSIAIATSILNTALDEKNDYIEGYCYFILSKAHWAKANYRLSTEFGFKALRIFENSTYFYLWGETLLALARTLTDLKNFSQAGAYLNRAMDLAVAHSNEALQADVFRERSFLLLEQKQYDSALSYSNRGIAFYESVHDSLNASILYGRNARIYFSLKDYKKSIVFNQKALQIDSLVGNMRALGVSYFQTAQDDYYLHNIDRSIKYLNKSIELTGAIGYLNIQLRARNLLAEIYFNQGNPVQAYKELKLVNQLKDSIYGAERNGQIQEMQALYELGNKESKIKLLEHENALKQQQVTNQRSFTIFLLVSIVLLLLLIFVLGRLRVIQKRANHVLEIKNRAIEQQKEEMEVQAESLQQLNRLKSKLFSVISHDLRGPIGNLQSLLELLTNRVMVPQEFLAVSDKLKANLDVTQRTLENLLNWSLSQMEGIKTEHETVDIKGAIEESCRLMEEVAKRKNVTLENLTKDPIRVVADPNQLQLILRNLIHNAIKFSKADGSVLISASADGQLCIVRVKDFGIGMTKVEIGMIMASQEYFTRAGTQQEKGTGLGLLLCKEFIMRHGGTLNIDSVPGKETTVSFTLPIAE